MPWRFDVEFAGQVVGELAQADSRAVTPRPLNSLPTAGAIVRPDNPMVPYLALGDRTRLKVYDELERLLFRGPVTSFEKVINSGQKSVAVGATGVGWKLGYRKLPTSKTQAGYRDGTALVPKDRSDLLANVVINVQSAGSEGIVIGTISPTGSVTYVGPWWEKFGLEAIVEIAAPLDGPDWRIVAIEDTDGGIGRLDVSPAFGQDRTDAVWEYGTGRNNVTGWTQRIDSSALANSIRNLPAGWPDTATDAPVIAEDAASIADRGLYEATIAAELTVADLRQKLAQAHVDLRKVPRQVITFEPSSKAIAELTYLTDYGEGDLIRFHALERFPVRGAAGQTIGIAEVDTVDIVTRLRSVTFNLSREGKVTPSFSIVEGG